MARIRTVKPELWADEALARLSRDSRLLFIGLFNVADDEGRMRGAPVFIHGQVFPYDEDIDITALLAQLERGGFIQRYEVEGQRYVFITNFKKHQKIDHASKSKLPEPPAIPREPLAKPSREAGERLAPDQGSGKGSGNRDQGVEAARETAPAEKRPSVQTVEVVAGLKPSPPGLDQDPLLVEIRTAFGKGELDPEWINFASRAMRCPAEKRGPAWAEFKRRGEPFTKGKLAYLAGFIEGGAAPPAPKPGAANLRISESLKAETPGRKFI